MQSTGVGLERFTRRHLVTRPKHDDVSAPQPVALVEFGKPRRGLLSDEVRAQAAGVVTQRAADDLLHPAFMQVDTRTKHAGEFRGSNSDCRTNSPCCRAGLPPFCLLQPPLP